MTEEAAVTLFRPVGPKELARIRELGFRAFPPRLQYQPIFYPVMNEEYARKIARDWNATREDTGYRGYVTRFRVKADYLARYPVQTVGASWHQELWVPADELDQFNQNIVGKIEIITAWACRTPSRWSEHRPNGPSSRTTAHSGLCYETNWSQKRTSRGLPNAHHGGFSPN